MTHVVLPPRRRPGDKQTVKKRSPGGEQKLCKNGPGGVEKTVKKQSRGEGQGTREYNYTKLSCVWSMY